MGKVIRFRDPWAEAFAELEDILNGSGVTGRDATGEPADELANFARCSFCGQMFDMRDLHKVLHHDRVGHARIPEN